MIKINLLPVRASKKREAGRQWLVLFALVLLGTGVGNYFWLNDTEKRLEQIDERTKKYKADVETLNKIIGEVKNIKTEKEEIQKKLSALKVLKEGRTGPVRIMDEFSTLITPRVWIYSWDENAWNMSFTASGTSHDEVANFVRKLKSSKFFTNVDFKGSRQAGENRVDFTFTCTANPSATP